MRKLILLVFTGIISSLCLASDVFDIPLGLGRNVDSISLVLDNADSPHIAFRDINMGDHLTYMRKARHGWVLDPIEKLVDRGSGFVSLSLSSHGAPRLSYFKAGSGLVYASKEGSQWDRSIIDPTCVGHTSLKIDSNSIAHISYFANQSLKYAVGDGVHWTTSTVDAGGIVGMWNSLALDPTGKPVISYYDSIQGDLKIAQWDGQKWSTQTVHSLGNTGMYSSIAIDSRGRPSISFIDNQDGLKFAQWNGTSWNIQTVDFQGEAFTSLDFDSADVPYISFASKGGKCKVIFFKNHRWSYYTNNDQKGNYSSLAISQLDRPHVAFASPLLWYMFEDPFPGPTFLEAVRLSTHSITWRWQDNSADESGFRILRASDMSPLTNELPANTTFWIQTGLTANSSSEILVRSWRGTEFRDSFAKLVFTLPLAPTEAKIVDSDHYSVKVSWSANGNPPNTQYRLMVNNDKNPSPLYVYVGTHTSGWTPTLTQETTSYIEVHALNEKGSPSFFSAKVSTYFVTPTPADPGMPWSTEQTTGSISWAWNDNSKMETGYIVNRTDPWGPLSPFLPPDTTTWVQTGMAPNTPSRVRIFAYKENSFIISDPSTITHTLAKIPTDGSASSSNGTTFDLTWRANGNPEGTIYHLEESTDGSSFSNIFIGTSTHLSLEQRSSTTTYYFRVRAVNHDGKLTDFNNVFSRTDPPPPTPLPPPLPPEQEIPLPPKDIVVTVISTNSILWGWIDQSDNEQGFRVRRKSDGLDLSGTLPMNTTFWMQTGLKPYSLYEITVESFNLFGTSSWTGLISTRTKANDPTDFHAQEVASTYVVLSWHTNNNPEIVHYSLQRSINPLFTPSFTIKTDLNGNSHRVDGLSSGTTYYFRLSIDGNAPVDLKPIFTPRNEQIRRFIDHERETVIHLDRSDGDLTLLIPSGAFDDNVEIVLEEVKTFPENSSDFIPLGIGFNISTQYPMKPRQQAFISLPLPETLDPKIDISKLSMARYDTSQKEWVPLKSKVDSEARLVKAETNELSIFQLVYFNSSNKTADDVVAYPNPFRAGNGVIVFKNIPIGSKVRIFSVSGLLMKEIQADLASVPWDVKSDDGEPVASGVYFVRVSGPGGDHTFKIIVQR